MRRVYKKPDYQFSKLGNVDGFHAEIFPDDTYVLIGDENGDPIPSNVCCCCATYETECVCGGFKNPIDN